MKTIPNLEIKATFARSGGKGGQNVNKVETKVVARWNVVRSRAFSDYEKERIRDRLRNRISASGELVVYAQAGRTQKENRARAIENLNELVSRALKVQKKRVPTRVPRRVRERRLGEKKKNSEKKSFRRAGE